MVALPLGGWWTSRRVVTRDGCRAGGDASASHRIRAMSRSVCGELRRGAAGAWRRGTWPSTLAGGPRVVVSGPDPFAGILPQTRSQGHVCFFREREGAAYAACGFTPFRDSRIAWPVAPHVPTGFLPRSWPWGSPRASYVRSWRISLWAPCTRANAWQSGGRGCRCLSLTGSSRLGYSCRQAFRASPQFAGALPSSSPHTAGPAFGPLIG